MIASELVNNRAKKTSKTYGKKNNIVWVPTGSGQSKAKDSVQASIARTAQKTKTKVIFQQILAKYENKKADQHGFDQAKGPKKQPRGQKFASVHQNHWRSHDRYSLPVPLMPTSWNPSPGMSVYSPWFWYSPWMPFYEYLHSSWVLPKRHVCDRLSRLYQEHSC